MADYAIQVEMGTSFQGAQETFSNVFTLGTNVGETFDDIQNIDFVVARLKAVMGTTVSFLTARSYGIGGSDISNVMREIKDLTGTGSQSGGSCYKECAILITWELPRSLILRRRRMGRKWLHVCQGPTAHPIGGATADGSGALADTTKNFYLDNFATPITATTWPGGGRFQSGGDDFTAPVVRPYLEHRQFHA